MRARGLRTGMLALGMLLVAVPAVALEESTPVSFGDISVSIPVSLGDSVDISVSPGEDPDGESFAAPPLPPATVFTIHPGRREGTRLPRIGTGETIIRAYRIADLEDYDTALDQVDALQAILDDRPDLRPFTVPGSDALPELPIGDLGQVLRVRPIYVTTPTVSGIRYVAAHEHPGDGGPIDRFPFSSDSFGVVFQGISNDGEWYISVTQDLETTLFPDEPTARDMQRANNRWTTYLNESIFKLKSASREDFSPSLTTVDQLLRSLDVTESGF